MTAAVRPQLSVFSPDVPSPGARPAPVFYGMDSRKISMREWWWGGPSSILLAGLLKLLRVRLQAVSDDPCVESLLPFEVEPSEVPGAIVQRSAIRMQQLKALGFHSPIWHVIQDDVNQVTTYLASLCHDSGKTWARIHHRVWHVHTPARAKLFSEFVSEFTDGRYVWSRSCKRDLSAPANWTTLWDVGAQSSPLLAAHQAALRETGATGARLVSAPDELRAAVDRHHAAIRDHHLTRGVFTPLSVDERQSATAFRASMNAAHGASSRFPEILAEVDRLQHKKASKSNGALILLVSIALFVAAGLTNIGGKGFSADFLVILVGVVFFHEMGHWVAMKLFGYRNMKMFFIPFLGAAVTGRNYNVAGWKKAIVSLMGPLPGLIVGALLGWLGVTLDHDLLIKISLITLTLNAFNLLPILPLDGGWIVQAILFSRHHLLELCFRIGALACLLILALVASDGILIAVAAVMALSLPSMYKLARITSELRAAKLPAGSDDGQTLPQATADVIVGKIKATFPAKLANKVAATYALQIFENLNARPPGVLVSIGFGIVQFGSLIGAVVVGAFIYAGASANNWKPLTASTIQVIRTPGESALAAPRNVVVATFDDAAELASALAEAARAGSSTSAVQRFGQSLFVALPLDEVDGLRTIQTRLEQQGAELFVATPTMSPTLNLSCTVASAPAAQAVEKELGGYFNGTGLNLRASWQPGSPWTPAERTKFLAARETYLRIATATATVGSDPAIRSLRDEMQTAIAADDSAQIERVRSKRTALGKTVRRARVAALRADPTLDAGVIDDYALIVSEGDSLNAFARATALIAPRLGQLPLVDGRAAPGSDIWSVTGTVNAEGSSVTASRLRFIDPFQGPPALARWLLASGCRDLRYDVRAGVDRNAPSSSD